MSNKVKLALMLAGLYLLLVVLFGAVGAVLWANMDPQEREATLAIRGQNCCDPLFQASSRTLVS